MKKLMFVAAVAAAMTGLADVTSANVVGYAQNNLQNGNTLLVPQFFAVGGLTEIDLQSIEATGDNVEDQVFMQFLDAGGVATNVYMWSWGPGLDNPTAEQRFVWATQDWDHAIEGQKVKSGTGLYVSGKASLQGIRTSGQVGQADVTVTLQNGNTSTGNPFPTSIDVQDIMVTGDNVEDQVFMQFLDAGGVATNVIMWSWGPGLDNPTAEQRFVWATQDWDHAIEGLTIQPGQGLYISGKSNKQYIVFPHPDL